jgi:ESS family glutamate:Na+ symporter
MLASAGAVIQNLLGMGLAAALHIDPRFGILTGSVALAGGPATALAFGPVFEKMGVPGATAAAFAAATFGITIAGLIAGYIGGSIIRKRQLTGAGLYVIGRPAAVESRARLLPAILVMGISIGLGSLLSDAISRRGIILPGYIGAMIVAAIIRNFDDRYHFARISQPDVTALGRIVLYLFIVMALLTLRLWELAHLALAMLAMLAAQVALCWLMCGTVVFWMMGRDYESAVTTAGFCGFMLGITSNAIASMEELVEKFGAAPRAFLVVPVVGAFLIDFTNSLIITAMANWPWLSR